MAHRPTWQGHLKLSLVTCPVALYTATNNGSDVQFHLINPKTGNRIRMVPTDPEIGPVERADLLRGFEVEKDRYILLSDEDMKSVKLESTRTIDIERFVPMAEIDRLYWDQPYYLAPDGKLAQEAFAVIRDAMQRSGRVALGRVVLSTRERLLALEPRDRGILAYSLRTENEVRRQEEIFDAIPDVKTDAGMIAIAEKIIEQQEGPFDPGQFTDRYEVALRDLIADRSKGRAPVASAPQEDSNVVDLMAALRASLSGKARSSSSDGPAKPVKAKRGKAPGGKRRSGRTE